jgi:hypothetical protein
MSKIIELQDHYDALYMMKQRMEYQTDINLVLSTLHKLFTGYRKVVYESIDSIFKSGNWSAEHKEILTKHHREYNTGYFDPIDSITLFKQTAKYNNLAYSVCVMLYKININDAIVNTVVNNGRKIKNGEKWLPFSLIFDEYAPFLRSEEHIGSSYNEIRAINEKYDEQIEKLNKEIIKQRDLSEHVVTSINHSSDLSSNINNVAVGALGVVAAGFAAYKLYSWFTDGDDDGGFSTDYGSSDIIE